MVRSAETVYVPVAPPVVADPATETVPAYIHQSYLSNQSAAATGAQEQTMTANQSQNPMIYSDPYAEGSTKISPPTSDTFRAILRSRQCLAMAAF